MDEGGNPVQPFERQALRAANGTLDAVAQLCEQSVVGKSGIRTVVTYNYDDLLEVALNQYPCQSFWRRAAAETDKMPIYHVHGFVPLLDDRGSSASEIIFTEEQYHSASHNPYSWANLVQIQSMSRLVGLMVGLSLSDRNMRRLLDAVTQLPNRPMNYVLLRRPQIKRPSNADLDEIQERAIQYKEKFEMSGIKRSGVKGPTWREQIRGILAEVQGLASSQQRFVLNELGINPIWYDDHNEIPTFVQQIL